MRICVNNYKWANLKKCTINRDTPTWWMVQWSCNKSLNYPPRKEMSHAYSVKQSAEICKTLNALRMSASWPLANGAIMCTDIKAKWMTIKTRLSCWVILKNPLEKPRHFGCLYRLIQSLPHRKFSISTQNAGILKYSSETVSRNSPSISASFARNKAWRGCDCFFHLSTFCAAQFPGV